MIKDKVTVRVTYAETDMYGVVYFPNYLKWTEMARGEYFRNTTNTSLLDIDKSGYLFPVVHTEADYKIPAKYDDLIDIETTISKIGKTSIHFEHLILRNSEELCKVKTTCVCVDKKFKPQKFPKEIISKLQD